MYISSSCIRNTVTVWERKQGKRIVKKFPAPFYFYVEDKDGEHKSIWGVPLRKEEFDNRGDFEEAKENYKARNIRLYESDIKPEVKILSEHYYGKEAPKLNITFFDIEVSADPAKGFARVDNPYGEIIAVSLYHKWLNKYVVLSIPPNATPNKKEFLKKLNELEPFENENNVELRFFKTEQQLLIAFLDEIEDSDLCSGWNSEAFDGPYIAKRIESQMGPRFLKRLSFPDAKSPQWRKTVSRFGQEIETIVVDGRIFVDYLVLYKKFEVIEKLSFKLEAIAEDVLPTMRKMQYTGKLNDLYLNDFLFFIRYNIRDTEILKAFEEKLGYVELANMLCNLTTAPWEYIPGTLKMAEAALINYCHYELKRIVADNTNTGDMYEDADVEEEEDNFDDEEDWEGPQTQVSKKSFAPKGRKGASISGAYVLDPKVGLHEWVGSIDIASLYPSSIRALNISPETLIGQFDETENAVEHIKSLSDTPLTLVIERNGKRYTKPAKTWHELLLEKKWCVSGYGTVFDQNKPGFVPSILASWYKLRKEYQAQKKGFENEAKAILEKYKGVT